MWLRGEDKFTPYKHCNRNMGKLSTTNPGIICLMSAWSAADVVGMLGGRSKSSSQACRHGISKDVQLCFYPLQFSFIYMASVDKVKTLQS